MKRRRRRKKGGERGRKNRAVTPGRERQREVAGGETDAPALLVMLAVAELPVCVTDGGGEHPNSPPQSAPCTSNPPPNCPHFALRCLTFHRRLESCSCGSLFIGIYPPPPPPLTTFSSLLPASIQLQPAPFTHSFTVSSTLTEGLLGVRTCRLCPVLEATGDPPPTHTHTHNGGSTAGCQAVPTSHPPLFFLLLPSHCTTQQATAPQ